MVLLFLVSEPSFTQFKHSTYEQMLTRAEIILSFIFRLFFRLPSRRKVQYNLSMYKNILILFVVYLAVLSLITFFVYLSDKKKAEKGKFRTPEKVLLALSFFGGALGAASAMKLCRHKTQKKYFALTAAFGLIWQLALLGFLIIKALSA